MQTTVVELRQLRKFRFVEHHHTSPADIDDFRLAQLPDDTVGVDLARTQNPSITRQHSVGRSSSDTIGRPASHGRTMIGNARMAAMSSSNPVTALSRRSMAANTTSRSNAASPSIR